MDKQLSSMLGLKCAKKDHEAFLEKICVDEDCNIEEE